MNKEELLDAIGAAQKESGRLGMPSASHWQRVVDMLEIPIVIDRHSNPMQVMMAIHAEVLKRMIKGEL